MLVLTFQVADDRLALPVHSVFRVVPRVQLRRAAGSPEWLAGMFVYRGQMVPVLDLHRLLAAGECPPHLSSRIILVPLTRNVPRTGRAPLTPNPSPPRTGERGARQEHPSPPTPLPSDRGEGSKTGETLLVGLLAAAVADLREVQPCPQPLPAFSAPGGPDLGMAVVDGGDVLHLLDVERMLPEPIKRLLETLPPELPE